MKTLMRMLLTAVSLSGLMMGCCNVTPVVTTSVNDEKGVAHSVSAGTGSTNAVASSVKAGSTNAPSAVVVSPVKPGGTNAPSAVVVSPVKPGGTNAPAAVVVSPVKPGGTNAPAAVVVSPVKPGGTNAPAVSAGSVTSTNAPAVIALPPMDAMDPKDIDGTGMQEWTIAVMVNKMFGVDEFWDSAQGLAVEIHPVTDKPWTLGYTFALDFWDGGGGVVDIPYTEYNEMTAEGATRTYQFGLVGSYRYLLREHYKLLVRLGLAYLTSDSSTRLTTSYTDHFNRQVTYELYLDNVSGLMGSAGLAIRKDEFLGYDNCFGQVGIDVQMFIAGSDVEWLRESMESSFDAAVLRVGVGTKF